MNPAIDARSVTLAIDDMSCNHCVQSASRALSRLPGIIVRSVSIGSAKIEARDEAAADAAVTALNDAGFPARVVKNSGQAPGSCCGGHSGGCGCC